MHHSNSINVNKIERKMKTENKIIPWCGLVTLLKNQRCEYSSISNSDFILSLSVLLSMLLSLNLIPILCVCFIDLERNEK